MPGDRHARGAPGHQPAVSPSDARLSLNRNGAATRPGTAAALERPGPRLHGWRLTWGTGPIGQLMPSTLADFLAAEETLARLRKRIAADPSDARRLRSDERALVQMLTRRWDLGLAGWLTADEARAIALELVSESDLLGLAAQAVVEDRDGQPFLVYRGSRYGDHVLALASTGPVAARSHWLVYLTSCPRRLQVVGGRP